MAAGRRAQAAAGVFALGLLAFSGQPAEAKVFHSQEEALELAFPDADRIDSQTYILTGSQKAAIEKLSRSELESELVTLFSGWRDGELLGRALIDIHTVRTLPEGLMVVLSPEGQVKSLRVLAFYEPSEYMPTKRWYRQFDDVDRQSLAKGLRLGRDVHGVVGATLSARAVTKCVRRALAYHQVLIVEVAAPPPSLPAFEKTETGEPGRTKEVEK